MNGAMYIAALLKQEGVTKVFGQCGHTNYGLIDACYRHGINISRSGMNAGDCRTFGCLLPRHAQAGGLMSIFRRA